MWKWIAFGVGVLVALILGAEVLGFGLHRGESKWQELVRPGPLSKSHAFIGDNCAACHTSVVGITRAKCVTCHANDSELVQRQPTAFHATISQCAACHYEHVPAVQRPIHMDHAALARIGLTELRNGDDSAARERARLLESVRSKSTLLSNPGLSSQEQLLDCASCHQVQDVHKGNFGQNCALCHGTKKWSVADYVHPSPLSRQCAQCHTASPCHFMESCLVMMRQMAGGEGALLEQCYLCHKTTSWYDFRKAASGHQ